MIPTDLHTVFEGTLESNVWRSKFRDFKVIYGAGSANESVVEQAYDCDGRLTRVWDANHPSNGQTQPASTVFGYDALDRTTFDDYPGTELDVTRVYDDPLVPFSKGRMTAIERDGHEIAMPHDRFGLAAPKKVNHLCWLEVGHRHSSSATPVTRRR